jgi:hypothetical protein
MSKFRLKLRLSLWAVLVIALAFLVYKFLIPPGHISYFTNFKTSFWGGRGFIEKFTPAERAIKKSGLLEVLGDPIYFSLFTPRKLETAKMTIEYRNLDPEKYPVIEAGLLMDNVVWSYDLEPLENNILEKLSKTWVATSENGLMFLQRSKKFNSLNDFLQSDINPKEVALYNYSLSRPVYLPDYQPQTNRVTLPVVRGAYQFYAYVKNEPLNFNFSFTNLNEDPKPDQITVNVYELDDKLIYNSSLDNEGEINVKLDNLLEGAYKVEVRASDDIVTSSLNTTQSRLVFSNKIWLLQPATLWTDNSKIKVKNVDPATRGEINFSGKNFAIDRTYEQFDLNSPAPASTNRIDVKAGGYIVEADGGFALSEDGLFSPNFKKVSSDLDLNNINYIIASYTPPQDSGDYHVAQAEFVLSNAYREFGKNSFMISIPGLKTGITSEENSRPALEIKSISFDLAGKSLKDKIYEKF